MFGLHVTHALKETKDGIFVITKSTCLTCKRFLRNFWKMTPGCLEAAAINISESFQTPTKHFETFTKNKQMSDLGSEQGAPPPPAVPHVEEVGEDVLEVHPSLQSAFDNVKEAIKIATMQIVNCESAMVSRGVKTSNVKNFGKHFRPDFTQTKSEGDAAKLREELGAKQARVEAVSASSVAREVTRVLANFERSRPQTCVVTHRLANFFNISQLENAKQALEAEVSDLKNVLT